MAVVFDTAVAGTSGSLISSLTYAITLGASANIIIVVVGGRDTTAGDRVVRGITYDGAALTKIRSEDNTTGGVFADIWYLANPTTGSSKNVIVTMDGGSLTQLASGAMSYSGVDVSGTPYEGATGANSGATPSADATVSVTSTTDNAMVIAGMMTTESAASDILPGTNTNERFEVDFGADNIVGGDEGPVTPAGARTINWTWTGSEDWAIAAAALKPSGGAPPPSATGGTTLSMMGVG